MSRIVPALFSLRSNFVILAPFNASLEVGGLEREVNGSENAEEDGTEKENEE